MRTWTPLPEPFYWRHPDWKLDTPPTTWEEHDANRDNKFKWHLGELWDLLGDECDRRGYKNDYSKEKYIMPIQKLIEVVPGVSWVNTVEYPDGTLSLEGVRESEQEHGAYAITRIRFSREAVMKLVPLMQEWLDQ